MLVQAFHRPADISPALSASKLYDETTFYPAFLKDLQKCQDEVIVESPFITLRRLRTLLPIFSRLISEDARVVINTRNPLEEDNAFWSREAQIAIGLLQKVGVTVLYTGGHHRKLATIDNCILWEGSLNILSQHDSCEVMRRIVSEPEAVRMKDFINIMQFLD